MKNLSKVFALMLILTIIFTTAASAEEMITPKFSDLDETHWAYDGINKLVGEGIIIGYPDGTFKPEGNITRAELVKIVNMVFEFTEKQEDTNFTDVNAEDWFYENVLIAQYAGYIVGYPDGTFKPKGLITREEFCKILDAINNFVELPLSTLPADEVSPWAVEFVTRVISNRIMLLDENNNFRALEEATRAEVCDTLAKFIIADVEEKFPSKGGSSDDSDSLYETMDRVIDRLNTRVIPDLSTEAQKKIVEDIILNMEKYQEDNKHDYEKAAQKAYDKYKLMTEDEQEELKYKIQLHNITQDLLDLKEFFFPDTEL